MRISKIKNHLERTQKCEHVSLSLFAFDHLRESISSVFSYINCHLHTQRVQQCVIDHDASLFITCAVVAASGNIRMFACELNLFYQCVAIKQILLALRLTTVLYSLFGRRNQRLHKYFHRPHTLSLIKIFTIALQWAENQRWMYFMWDLWYMLNVNHIITMHIIQANNNLSCIQILFIIHD